jgi:hypothetical protein
MLQKPVFAGLLAAVFCGITARTADAIGMRLGKPGIAIPHTGENGKRDATVEAMNKVFREQASQFVGGHYCNTHSVLHYAGGTRTVNLLLDELSRIDGAVLQIQFSKERGITEMQFADRAEQPKPCDVRVDHNAWGSAHEVIMTIYLGGDGVNLEDIALPAIQGRASPK